MTCPPCVNNYHGCCVSKLMEVVNIQRIVRGRLARRNFSKLEDAKYAIRDLFIFLVYLVLHVFYGFRRKSSPDLFYMSDIMEDYDKNLKGDFSLVDINAYSDPGGIVDRIPAVQVLLCVGQC